MRKDTGRLPSHITAFACTFPDFINFEVTLANDPRKKGIDIPKLLDDKHDVTIEIEMIFESTVRALLT